VSVAVEVSTADTSGPRLGDAGSTPACRSDELLRVAPVSARAARFAVERWHYSHSMPMPPLAPFGVWESGRFIGVVLFSRGANRHAGNRFGLTPMQVCELTRVALTTHATPVTQILAAAIRQLREVSPGLRMIVSYADPAQGHHGGIYQAGNWLYLGATPPVNAYRERSTGKLLHSRVVTPEGILRQFGKLTHGLRKDQCDPVKLPGRHRYVLPLDRQMRRRLVRLAQQPPKAVR
jgi:hypothetical protein